MAKVTRLTAEQRANLVAYLDSELDETAVRAIEETLSGSPAARRDVEILSRTWDLLDLLPKVDPGEDFTHRTISKLHTLESDKAKTAARWGSWGRRLVLMLVWVAGIIGASAAGVYAAVTFLPNTGQRVIQDFPVVEDLDLYRSLDSVDFLKELDRNHLFEDEREEADQ